MKHTLFVLAVWLMSAPDSYSQTNKMDDYIVKDASLASARRSAASIPTKPTGYMVNGDPATVAKPTVPQKLQSIIGHTQNLRNTTQVLKANTEAIEANTKALMANTEALAANMKASQTNKHLRGEQMHQATPVPPAPKAPVYSPAVLAHKPAVRPAAPTPVVMAALPKAPATVAVAAMPKPAPVATAAAPKAPAMPKPAPVAIAAVPKAPAKPQSAPVAKEMPKPAPVVPIAKVPMKPIELPESRTVSTMPVAAAPVKAEKSATMGENSRTFSTMSMAGNVKVVPTVANKDLPNPAAAKSTKPVEVKGNPMTAMSMVAGTVPSGKPVAAAAIMPPAAPKPSAMTKPAVATTTAVKMTDIVRNSKSVKITDLVQLPLMDKMYDCKISNPKYYPYAAKYGLKHGDMITTQGYLQVVATEDSGKVSEAYLLQLTVNTTKGDTCFMVRIPAEQLAKFGGKESTDNSKKFVRELVKGRIPCTGGNIIRKPVYVSVTGQLAYIGSRAAYMRKEKVAAQGKRDMNAYTPWEINASNVAFATAQ